MKRLLSAFLSLCLILTIVPMTLAATETVISGKSYGVTVMSKEKGGTAVNKNLGSVSGAKSISFAYNLYDGSLEPIFFDRWGNEDQYMAVMKVSGFDTSYFANLAVGSTLDVWVDGARITDPNNAFPGMLGYGAGSVAFPLHLNKSGISTTKKIEVRLTRADGTIVTERAEIRVDGRNDGYAVSDRSMRMSVTSKNGNAYMKDNTVYVDYWESSAPSTDELTFTFFDSNGYVISEIAYLQPSQQGKVISNGETKLKDGKVTVDYKPTSGDNTGIEMRVRTQYAMYISNKLSIVYRTGVTPVDVKGIYFSESSRTIGVGESYKPTVMGVITGYPCDAKISVDGSQGGELSVINVLSDEKTVYGLRPGTTYIRAEYDAKNGISYTAASMKITVVDRNNNPVDPSGTKMYCTASSLNVRSGPGTNYSRVGSISRGTQVNVVSSTGSWYKITWGTGYAYVSSSYFTPVTSTTPPTERPDSSIRTVTGGSVNVRTGPGTNYGKAGLLRKGARVTVTAQTGGWYKIVWGNGSAYISTKYVR